MAQPLSGEKAKVDYGKDKNPASPKKCPIRKFPTGVMVRAHEDEPVRLNALSADDHCVVVAGSDCRKAIGFQATLVFELDDNLFGKLRAAYRGGDNRKLAILWERARPLIAS